MRLLDCGFSLRVGALSCNALLGDTLGMVTERFISDLHIRGLGVVRDSDKVKNSLASSAGTGAITLEASLREGYVQDLIDFCQVLSWIKLIEAS